VPAFATYEEREDTARLETERDLETRMTEVEDHQAMHYRQQMLGCVARNDCYDAFLEDFDPAMAVLLRGVLPAPLSLKTATGIQLASDALSFCCVLEGQVTGS
jgi:hypothetical protein